MDGNRCSIDINRKIVEFIDSGRSFAVALILKVEGSTPRKAGVKAVIDDKGKIWGTLGGGQVEAEAQRRAVEVCKSKHPIVFDMNLYGADRADDVPICGGSMRLLIDPMPAKDRASYAQVAEAMLQRQRGVMLTIVRSAEHTEVQSQWFLQEDIPLDAAFPGTDNIRFCLAQESSQLFVENSENPKVFKEVLVEPVIPKPLLVIAGGGHIGQALALQASLVGFDITVIDDRSEFTDPSLFPEGTTTLDGDIPKLITAQPIAGDTYIVLVTRGHKLDAESLEACIHTPAAYIGMIGSKRKVALIRKNFIESGLATEEEFGRIHAPIGLDIGAVTVPEIAASITAELIAVRRKRNPDLSTGLKGLQ
ncbi:MAG: XdhC/CoxI family protein [Sedimentisphaerales bacterium]|nr:XdhC/CoxI family protein [Sedimentisphaerales bacterium]